MPSFDIAWTRRTGHQWRKNADGWVVEATLVERVLLDDRPALRIVCRLAVRTGSTTSPRVIASGTTSASGSAGCIASTAATATRSRP
jgi:hypothetical protein